MKLSPAGIGIDVARKLRRGRLEHPGRDRPARHLPHATDAREALAAFLREAVRQGLRCVRVVHGKGLGSPGKTPVLKGKVHGWLVQKDEVMAFMQAKRGRRRRRCAGRAARADLTPLLPPSGGGWGGARGHSQAPVPSNACPHPHPLEERRKTSRPRPEGRRKTLRPRDRDAPPRYRQRRHGPPVRRIRTASGGCAASQPPRSCACPSSSRCCTDDGHADRPAGSPPPRTGSGLAQHPPSRRGWRPLHRAGVGRTRWRAAA